MKLRSIIINWFFLICSSQLAIAAGPVTHVYLAQRWLDLKEPFYTFKKNRFIRGTLFPDIRYLVGIPRKETHISNVNLNDILYDNSPFSKGKKLHSFIDEKRGQIVAKKEIYRKLKNIPGQKYINIFLKLLEDEIIYHKNDWQREKAVTALSFNDNDYEVHRIRKEDSEKWHWLLIGTFSMPPSIYITEALKGKKSLFGIPKNILAKWAEILPKLAEEERFKKHVDYLIEEFDGFFKTAGVRPKKRPGLISARGLSTF